MGGFSRMSYLAESLSNAGDISDWCVIRCKIKEEMVR